eukprot:GHVO01010823.1.p1 GENE.GHVO01010823.1~~GHVO01010823.1.p1  ORF type:complete len:175 (+),score=17.61 GHVO01010823.1:179-703(+)
MIQFVLCTVMDVSMLVMVYRYLKYDAPSLFNMINLLMMTVGMASPFENLGISEDTGVIIGLVLQMVLVALVELAIIWIRCAIMNYMRIFYLQVLAGGSGWTFRTPSMLKKCAKQVDNETLHGGVEKVPLLEECRQGGVYEENGPIDMTSLSPKQGTKRESSKTSSYQTPVSDIL